MRWVRAVLSTRAHRRLKIRTLGQRCALLSPSHVQIGCVSRAGTGTAGGGVNRQDAAFAITSINSDAIERAACKCLPAQTSVTSPLRSRLARQQGGT